MDFEAPYALSIRVYTGFGPETPHQKANPPPPKKKKKDKKIKKRQTSRARQPPKLFKAIASPAKAGWNPPARSLRGWRHVWSLGGGFIAPGSFGFDSSGVFIEGQGFEGFL